MGLIHQVVMIMCLNATLGITGGGRVHGEMFMIDKMLIDTINSMRVKAFLIGF